MWHLTSPPTGGRECSVACYVVHCYHCSYDSNNPLMVGDVGLAGVAIDSVEDMKVNAVTWKYLHINLYSYIDFV